MFPEQSRAGLKHNHVRGPGLEADRTGAVEQEAEQIGCWKSKQTTISPVSAE